MCLIVSSSFKVLVGRQYRTKILKIQNNPRHTPVIYPMKSIAPNVVSSVLVYLRDFTIREVW